MYDLILVSTCCNHLYIYRLLESVLSSNSELNACIIIVNQDAQSINPIHETRNTHVKIIEYGIKVNTSIARNIAIHYILTNHLQFNFICFPDDDSSFDSNFFYELSDQNQHKTFKNLVTDVYCVGTKKLFRDTGLKNDTCLTRHNFNIVGAVNIILNYETFMQVKYFDERFGVNALYGAGEDGDYFIRAVQYQPFYFSNQLYSYHPSNSDKFKLLSYNQTRMKLRSYGKGVIALLIKHKMYLQAIKVIFRALGGVAISFKNLKFTLGLAYFEAFFVRIYCFLKFLFFGLDNLERK